MGSFLEHDAQQLHVVGVPGLTELIEDCLFEDCAEVLRVSHTQLPQAAQEQSAGLLLQSLLDQEDHHLGMIRVTTLLQDHSSERHQPPHLSPSECCS